MKKERELSPGGEWWRPEGEGSAGRVAETVGWGGGGDGAPAGEGRRLGEEEGGDERRRWRSSPAAETGAATTSLWGGRRRAGGDGCDGEKGLRTAAATGWEDRPGRDPDVRVRGGGHAWGITPG